MDQLFIDSKIRKIAIVDDDLSQEITYESLICSDNANVAGILDDENDPDYDGYIQLLRSLDKPIESVQVRAAALTDENVRKDAPALIKELAESVITKRASMAVGVIKVKQWIIDIGFSEENIHSFGSPDEFFSSDEAFDLVLVDYLLVDDSEEATKQLISKCLDDEAATKKQASEDEKILPQLFILMSSHEEQLKTEFQNLRKELKTTSSRFRILKKPENDDTDKAEWLHTIHQVIKERELVNSIEDFISGWGRQFEKAAINLKSSLWNLDAYSLDILRHTAIEDHVGFSDYFSEIIMRKVLAEMESELSSRKVTNSLSDKLYNFESSQPISPGTEVSDSRSFLRSILQDVSWHRQEWYSTDNYPQYDSSRAESIKRLQFRWVLKNLGFGAVLRNKKTKEIIVHLTQPCDLAHLEYDAKVDNHLLLFPGIIQSVDNNTKSKISEAFSPSVLVDSDWVSIRWQLSRPYTPTIDGFLSIFEGMEIIGQLRSDQAQQIASRYSAKVSRIATLKIPTFSEIKGQLFTLKEEDSKLVWIKASDEISAHLLSHAKNYVVNFSAKYSAKIATILGDDEQKVATIRRSLISGVTLEKLQAKLGAKQNSNKNILLLNSPLSKEPIDENPSEYFSKIEAIAKLTKNNNVDTTFLFLYRP